MPLKDLTQPPAPVSDMNAAAYLCVAQQAFRTRLSRLLPLKGSTILILW